MEKKDACSIFSVELEEMQATRRVNDKAISTIKTVIEECESREKFWLTNTEVSAPTAFVLFHASRNMRIIFEKMKDNLISASQIHANPKVVDDAATVFPELSEMCSLLDSLKNVEISPEMLEYIRRRVRSLRNTAQRTSMLPTAEEEAKSVNRDELAKQLEDLANDFRANLL